MAPKKKPVAMEGGADSSSGRGSKRKPAEHEYAVHGKRVSRKPQDDDFQSMDDTDDMDNEQHEEEEVQQQPQHEHEQQHQAQQEHQQQEQFEQHDQLDHQHHQQQQEQLQHQELLQQQQQQVGAADGMAGLTDQQAQDADAIMQQQLMQAQLQQQQQEQLQHQHHALTLHHHAQLLAQQQQQQQQQLMQAVQMPNTAADVARSHLESVKKADLDQMARAKRAGNLATVHLTLDLPPELQTQETTGRSGMVEVPTTGDVQMFKRLLMYASNMQLVPTLQQLFAESLDGSGQMVPMVDEHIDEEGKKSPMPLSVYGIKDGSTVTVKITVPDDPQAIPIVDEAVASAAYAAGGGSAAPARTPSRKQRWTMEQIDALVEGVEKNGLSAWRAIVSDPRLAGKNNMQCKDKFRNLCLTIIQGRPERGLTLSWPLKERLRAFIEREHITF